MAALPYNSQEELGNRRTSLVGIIGAFLAGWLLPLVGFVLVGGIVAEIINAVIGAVILLLLIGLFKRD